MMDEERKVEGVVEVIARAVFRAGFHPNEDEAHVDEKWIEWDDKRRLTLGMTDNAFKALTEAGFAIVPVEPTEAMLDAGTNALLSNGVAGIQHNDSFVAYRAMIEAGRVRG